MGDRDEALQRSLDALSSYFVGNASLRETLLRVAELGEQALPGARFTGVTLLDDGRPTTAIVTGNRAYFFDQVQYDNGSGPCLEAYRRKSIIRVSATEETRWPDVTAEWIRQGVLSSLSVPLVVADRGIGAMNFYGEVQHAFSAEDEAIGVAFGGQAAVVLANSMAYWGAHELSEQLDEALKSRATIEQAKGILMAREGCGPDEAFDMLRRASQRTNTKLRDLAAEMVQATRQPASPEIKDMRGSA
jgi:GAF domain-containing protein